MYILRKRYVLISDYYCYNCAIVNLNFIDSIVYMRGFYVYNFQIKSLPQNRHGMIHIAPA